ncbi:MAG: hypothetical protein A2281_16445 [Bacteroidetes bacterium RIFOXYA12_FULL_38_20]|nr:MAG: hypothetical protein A2281_16445 [Bacteroidetes bacterium RIFOXYA12_FULL_38_20]
MPLFTTLKTNFDSMLHPCKIPEPIKSRSFKNNTYKTVNQLVDVLKTFIFLLFLLHTRMYKTLNI